MSFGLQPAFAADIVVQPAAGSGFVVKDAAGTNERLRVQDNGAISMGNHTQAAGIGAIAAGDGAQATARAAAAMGYATLASGLYSTALGYATTATNTAATALGTSTSATGNSAIAMGYLTQATGDRSTAMGNATQASGDRSTAMGENTRASGTFSTAMGVSTTASGYVSTAMGSVTSASGSYTLAMGYRTSASGQYSIALGPLADTNSHAGAFAYGDSSFVATQNTANNQFMVRASGGFVFYSGTDTSTGVQLAAGSGSWTTLSDRRAKDQLQAIDARAILDKVIGLPLSSWHYRAQPTAYRHLGPMAQDFYQAFRLGETETGIDTVDADGVALAAIQGLNAKLEQHIAAQDRELAALRAQLDRQLAEMARLKAGLAEVAGIAADVAALKVRLEQSRTPTATFAKTAP